MNKNKFISKARSVIDLEINALKKLKKSINSSFTKATIQIAKCNSKVILDMSHIRSSKVEDFCYFIII